MWHVCNLIGGKKRVPFLIPMSNTLSDGILHQKRREHTHIRLSLQFHVEASEAPHALDDRHSEIQEQSMFISNLS